MGGSSRISSYDDAVRATRSLRSSDQAFNYSTQATRSGRGTVHRNLDPKGVTMRECLDTAAMPKVTPIAFAMDVTRSRGQDAKTVYEQTMPFLGALFMTQAVTDPQLLFLAFGDAKSDRAPLQVGQFESNLGWNIAAGQTRSLWLAIDPAAGLSAGNSVSFALESGSKVAHDRQ